MRKEKIKLAVVDDHKLFREGLVALLKDYEEFSVNLEAANGIELFEELSKRKKAIDVLILDVEMPEMDGIAVLKKIKGTHPEIRVLILTMHNEDELIYELVELGAKGFLLKNADIEEVVDAVHAVYMHRLYFNNDISQRVLKKLVKKESIKRISINEGITEREKVIIKLICEEHTTKEIAEKLFLSTKTIESHKNNIFRKTKAKNSAGIALYAIRTGIVE